ncbi:MAG: hypothetical protein JW748_15255 [Anaerolineales bacterium]|nr:hypothetical protein [Anaerolineales bacterium]
MSADIYIQCFLDGEPAGLPWQALILLFPVQTAESTPDFWQVRYDAQNSCGLSVSTLPANDTLIESLCIRRPCGDERLWRSLYTLLRMGNVVLYFPNGSPPVVADEAVTAHLPPGMLDSLGRPRCVRSGAEIEQAAEDTP